LKTILKLTASQHCHLAISVHSKHFALKPQGQYWASKTLPPNNTLSKYGRR